ncbi:MAG TPA: DUF2207 domain-containing protein [Desulfobulbaceae bacterium]|nr:DUF2207 domain-containing protein [Desulfobulbaceae bacterium]
MPKSVLRGFLLLLITFQFFCGPLLANERITSFDSRITVDANGLLTVTETISVVAEGSEIKRGIFRDFPTTYTDRAGHRVRVDFTPLSVERDGGPESYHLEEMGNGVRVYMGQADVFLAPGPYTYTLTYQTSRQIGFFADYDELYWNVTGNGWSFPIDTASATIVLPEGTPLLQHAFYTGPQGSTAAAAEMTRQEGSSISFSTTAPLAAHEGLTVAVAWPKGVVAEPDAADRAASFVKDNLDVLAAATGLLILLAYYLVVWIFIGKDPPAGTIIPRYEPPKGFSPAAARFVMRMGFDHKAFACALVELAVKKNLVIEDDQGTFTLKRTREDNNDALSSGEKTLVKKLFAVKETLKLKQTNHLVIQEAISALEKGLRDGFETLHFKRNSRYLLPGLGITLLVLLAIILCAHDSAAAGFLGLWLSIWTAGCYALLLQTYNAWRTAASSGFVAKGAAVASTLFTLPFLAGWIFGFVSLVLVASLTSVAGLAAVLALNLLFYHLLKAPTILGRSVMDQLEGLKMYLSVAEKDRLNLLNPPEKTPALFEQFLPWALALDVEQQWSEQFSDLLAQAGRDGGYAPAWYTGHGAFSSGGLASSLGSSLASSISSSSTAPGSSSGSGGSSGGGSSGGGGGGGGGGGW